MSSPVFVTCQEFVQPCFRLSYHFSLLSSTSSGCRRALWKHNVCLFRDLWNLSLVGQLLFLQQSVLCLQVFGDRELVARTSVPVTLEGASMYRSFQFKFVLKEYLLCSSKALTPREESLWRSLLHKICECLRTLRTFAGQLSNKATGGSPCPQSRQNLLEFAKYENRMFSIIRFMEILVHIMYLLGADPSICVGCKVRPPWIKPVGQEILQILSQIEISGIWRSGQHLELFIKFFIPFLNKGALC